MLAIYCSIAIGVSGCSTLPEHKTLPTASVAVEPIDTSGTTLAQIIEPLQQQNPKTLWLIDAFQ
jgi:putative cardiolipin synthase